MKVFISNPDFVLTRLSLSGAEWTDGTLRATRTSWLSRTQSEFVQQGQDNLVT